MYRLFIKTIQRYIHIIIQNIVNKSFNMDWIHVIIINSWKINESWRNLRANLIRYLSLSKYIIRKFNNFFRL